MATQAFNDAKVLDSPAREAQLRSVIASLSDVARRPNPHQVKVQSKSLSTLEEAFNLLGEPKAAAAVYESLERFDDAVRIFRSSGDPDLEGALELCFRRKAKIEPETFDGVMSVGSASTGLYEPNEC